LRIRVSVVQLDIVLGRADVNRDRVVELVIEVARRGSKVVVLPELWLTGYASNIDSLAEDVFKGVTVAILSKIAKDYGIYIFGSIPEKNSGKIYNSIPLITPRGVAGVYRKIHLFKLMNEHKIFSPGDKVVVLETEFGRIGFAICYDIRFPEMIRSMVFNGIKILIIPAEWPCQRIDVWRTLIRSRAIENQIYVLASNRVGEDTNNKYCGNSAIIDPYGDYVVEAGRKEEAILTTDIDLDLVEEARETIPILKDYIPEVYSRVEVVKS
jgi:predicted amidohydrolase